MYLALIIPFALALGLALYEPALQASPPLAAAGVTKTAALVPAPSLEQAAEAASPKAATAVLVGVLATSVALCSIKQKPVSPELAAELIKLYGIESDIFPSFFAQQEPPAALSAAWKNQVAEVWALAQKEGRGAEFAYLALSKEEDKRAKKEDEEAPAQITLAACMQRRPRGRQDSGAAIGGWEPQQGL